LVLLWFVDIEAEDRLWRCGFSFYFFFFGYRVAIVFAVDFFPLFAWTEHCLDLLQLRVTFLGRRHWTLTIVLWGSQEVEIGLGGRTLLL
jgi:hypothetical protein